MKLIKNIKPEAVDERGSIIKIFDNDSACLCSILLITSKAGTIRANHYHKGDSHYCYMISGKMEYVEQPVGVENAQRQSVIIEAGDIIFTEPMVAHAMRFLEDSVFLALTSQPRNQDAYEQDIVRVDLI